MFRRKILQTFLVESSHLVQEHQSGLANEDIHASLPILNHLEKTSLFDCLHRNVRHIQVRKFLKKINLSAAISSGVKVSGHLLWSHSDNHRFVISDNLIYRIGKKITFLFKFLMKYFCDYDLFL